MTSRVKGFAGRASRCLGFALALALPFSCGKQAREVTGGETHFLTRCAADADACGTGLECLCGVCTLRCDERAACRAFPAASCVFRSQAEACAEPPTQGLCDVQCVADADCRVLSAQHRCEAGACRAGLPTASNGGAGGSGGGAEAGTGGDAGATACVRGETSANEVLLVGDAFFASTHQITAYLESLARAAGALPTGGRYRDNSNLKTNGLALNGNGIAKQYTDAAADAAVKVVIMNGGGADVLLGSCDVADASCPVIAAAAAAARELFATMASDGIEHVIYAYYPDPAEEGLRDKVRALRPLIQSACESSPVPCHWLDLRDTFAGHDDDYLQPEGVIPSDGGSQATATAIWSMMQRYCIAQ